MTLLLLQTLVGGILQAGIYALITVGLTLTLGVLGIINFAHGEFLMIAIYLTWLATNFFGIGPYWVVLLSVPVLYMLGVLVVRWLLLPIIEREVMAQLLVMMGLSIVLINVALVVFSSDIHTVRSRLPLERLELSGLIIDMHRLLAFLVSVLVTAALFFFLGRTDLGRAIRAAAQNRRAAGLVGIDVKRIYQIAFGIGVGCLGVAGPFLAPVYYVTPHIGTFFILVAFVIVIVGGMGNLVGALVASLIVGLAEAFGAILMPGSTGPILPFLILVLVLLFKPEGLIARRG